MSHSTLIQSAVARRKAEKLSGRDKQRRAEREHIKTLIRPRKTPRTFSEIAEVVRWYNNCDQYDRAWLHGLSTTRQWSIYNAAQVNCAMILLPRAEGPPL